MTDDFERDAWNRIRAENEKWYYKYQGLFLIALLVVGTAIAIVAQLNGGCI